MASRNTTVFFYLCTNFSRYSSWNFVVWSLICWRNICFTKNTKLTKLFSSVQNTIFNLDKGFFKMCQRVVWHCFRSIRFKMFRLNLLRIYFDIKRCRFRSLCKSYFRRADGAILVYDCMVERTFLRVREWVDIIRVRFHTQFVTNCNITSTRSVLGSLISYLSTTSPSTPLTGGV